MTSFRTFRVSQLAAAALLAVSTFGAHAQFFDDRDARKAILELRQRLDAERTQQSASQARLIEEVQRSSNEAAALRGTVLDMQSQIEALRADIARLRGQNDQVVRDFAESQRRQQDGLKVYDERLRKLEPFKVSVDNREFVVDAAEKRDYEAALATFRSGDFVAAQASFLDFTRRYPTSGFTPSALFWLGNAQYANRDYKGAVTNLRAMLLSAPDHPRAADAQLAVANSLIELGDNAGARRGFEDLVRAYPQTEAAAAARDRLSKLK